MVDGQTFIAGAFTVEQEQAQLTCLEVDCERTGRAVCMEEAKRAWRDRRASRRNGRSAKPTYSDFIRKKYGFESARGGDSNSECNRYSDRHRHWDHDGSDLVHRHMVYRDAFDSSMGLDTDSSLGWAFLEKVDSTDSEYSPSVSPRDKNSSNMSIFQRARILEEAATDKGLVVWGVAN
jgi:hypothetical protein